MQAVSATVLTSCEQPRVERAEGLGRVAYQRARQHSSGGRNALLDMGLVLGSSGGAGVLPLPCSWCWS
jgi:hypothetical protein